MNTKTKDIMMIVVGILVLAVLFWFRFLEKVTWLELPVLVLAFAVALPIIFRFDLIKRLVIDVKLSKDVVQLRTVLESVVKAVEPVKDLEISVEEKIPVGEEGTVEVKERVNVTVKPEVIRLQAIVNKVQVLVSKTEKHLSGKAEAKSDVRGDLTVEKKKEAEMVWEKIKCYLCENDEAIMKPDPQGGALDEIIRCPTCKFYRLTYPIKKYYFETKLLTKQDKEKLSLNIQKDYDPKKEDEPVQITREMIKKETGKESVGYR